MTRTDAKHGVLSRHDALRALREAGIDARWLREPVRDQGHGVSIDSRAVEAGNLFVALRGERTDGHLFLSDAARADAWAAMVERADVEIPADGVANGMGVLLVPDARAALVALARAHRGRLADAGTRVIGLTGSVGKTTTTRLIHGVLSTTLSGTCPRKSFNNMLGVPITLLGARAGDGYVVCEIGTSSPGEIAALADVALPDCGLVISVGHAHLEKLGSLDGVAKEKASLLQHVRAGGLRVVRADTPLLLPHARAIAREGGAPLVTYALADSGVPADHLVSDVRTDDAGVSFTLSGFGELRAGVVGAHNALNAAAAAIVARWAGLNDASIRAGLQNARGAEMRMELCAFGGVRVIDDAYNANPDSMLAGVRTLVDLAEIPESTPRAVAILGDMGELGPDSDALHQRVLGATLEEPKIALVIVIGSRMATAADRLRARRSSSSANRLIVAGALDDVVAKEVAARTLAGDLVLVKASRSTGLERVVRAIQAIHAPSTTDTPSARASGTPHLPAHAAR
ncbi:MAG: UDP-N-acetylmuramoyl-tripeptide--D-alanyl-D-alanine ligase [Phycisphaerales bacterium]|nr:UDP-N-acetylmuramoyl-tripeptide--D-alanyl-D-alanine ligase [Phycisphaerales bacterium]